VSFRSDLATAVGRQNIRSYRHNYGRYVQALVLQAGCVLSCTRGKCRNNGKSRVVPVPKHHAKNAYWESVGIAQLIINLGT
jgi:hypothetical protein